MAIVTIVGADMMGSALAFPARENANEVRLVGTPLDREIIETCRKTNRHPKFKKGTGLCEVCPLFIKSS